MALAMPVAAATDCLTTLIHRVNLVATMQPTYGWELRTTGEVLFLHPDQFQFPCNRILLRGPEQHLHLSACSSEDHRKFN